MRHAKRNQRLSRPTAQRQALVHNLARSLVLHGQLQTTYARAREVQRLADQLITLGKEGSIHSRRRALRVLQDRTLVKHLFAEVAPRFVDVQGGYTRVTRLSPRQGDGAQRALLAFSRLPAAQPALPSEPQPAPGARPPGSPEGPKPQPAEAREKPKGFFEGLRNLWKRSKKGGPIP